MPILRLKKGNITYDVLVDADDVPLIKLYTWTIENNRPVTKVAGSLIPMHRLIMKVHKGDPVLIDHINGNFLDNRKENLRRADRFQNQQNRKTNKGNTLPKGIRQLPSGKYNVRVQTYNARIGIGTYDTLEEAIEARNKAAQELHGEFFRESYDIASETHVDSALPQNQL